MNDDGFGDSVVLLPVLVLLALKSGCVEDPADVDVVCVARDWQGSKSALKVNSNMAILLTVFYPDWSIVALLLICTAAVPVLAVAVQLLAERDWARGL